MGNQEKDCFLNRDKGFSLIELMIVVLVIGIGASMAVLYIDTSDDRLKAQSSRLFSLLRYLQDDAIINAAVHSVSIEKQQYRIYHLQKGEWILAKDKPFTPVSVDKDIHLKVLLESIPGQFSDDANMIYFLPSGEISEFKLWLKNDSDGVYLISHTFLDGLRFSKKDATDEM